MIFGQIPVANAEGLILAHSVRLAGGAFKKGRVLSSEDVLALQAGGVAEVSGSARHSLGAATCSPPNAD